MVPRTLDEQVQWIDEHSGGHPAVVAVVAGEDGAEHVVGFGSLSPFRPRPAYATTVENSVYLLAEYQGRGIGRMVLEELLRLAESHGFHSVIARIAGSNDASIALHAGVRVRARGHRTRGRPQVRPLARRGGDAAPALVGIARRVAVAGRLDRFRMRAEQFPGRSVVLDRNARFDAEQRRIVITVRARALEPRCCGHVRVLRLRRNRKRYRDAVGHLVRLERGGVVLLELGLERR